MHHFVAFRTLSFKGEETEAEKLDESLIAVWAWNPKMTEAIEAKQRDLTKSKRTKRSPLIFTADEPEERSPKNLYDDLERWLYNRGGRVRGRRMLPGVSKSSRFARFIRAALNKKRDASRFYRILKKSVDFITF